MTGKSCTQKNGQSLRLYFVWKYGGQKSPFNTLKAKVCNLWRVPQCACFLKLGHKCAFFKVLSKPGFHHNGSLICILTCGSIRSIFTLCRLHSACANGFSVHLWGCLCLFSSVSLLFKKCLFFSCPRHYLTSILSITSSITTRVVMSILLPVTGSLNHYQIILYHVFIVPLSFVTSRNGSIRLFLNCRLHVWVQASHSCTPHQIQQQVKPR